ncbi:MAG: hypothetical protein AAF517_05205, partial [Planctomycetota bacterium]
MKIQSLLSALIIGSAAFTPFARTLAADWEHFLGPGGFLVSKETAWRHDWKSRAPKQLWQMNVGTGFAAVAISNGLAYTLGSRGGKDT